MVKTKQSNYGTNSILYQRTSPQSSPTLCIPDLRWAKGCLVILRQLYWEYYNLNWLETTVSRVSYIPAVTSIIFWL